MENNLPVWKYYQPGFVHPDFVPYLREDVVDYAGRNVNVNTWLKTPVAANVNPALVRKGWGMAFMRQHAGDPCPTGFVSAPDGYCVPVPRDHVPVFYTRDAFIAKNQFWRGYGDEGAPRISQSTDMRSVNPFTGNYTYYFKGSDGSGSETRPHKEGYRPENGRYAKNPCKDSYLA